MYARQDKRIETRYDFPSTIEYVLDPPTNGGTVHRGVTVNISNTGLGVYLFDQHMSGQKIVIKTVLPVDYQSATICWSRKEDASFYFSGLKFM